VEIFLEKRNLFYRELSGSGLEIGAFEHPALLPSNCTVKYCDVINKKQAKELFPEVTISSLPEIDLVIDLDQNGLAEIPDRSQDFIIINHVLEHLFDPIFAVNECYRVLKHKGSLVLSVPDKRFTYDKNRPLSSLCDIQKRIRRVPKLPTPDDYVDMIEFLHTELLEKPESEKLSALKRFMKRREHLNVWTDQTFIEFFKNIISEYSLDLTLQFEVLSHENNFEYFSAWKKNS
jgi:SAM-dependent methyltransferase